MRLTTLVVMVAVIAGTGQTRAMHRQAPVAPAPSAPVSAAQRQILDLEARRFKALLDADIPTLKRLMRDDCTYTHSTGVTQDRDAYLAPIADGRTRYRTAEGTDLRVRVYGDTAIVTGRASLNAMVAGDPVLHVNDLRYTNVWIRANGEWRLAAWHSSRVQ